MVSGYRSIVAPPGFAVFPPPQEAIKTFCILGAPRGGTSMVAGLLLKLGVAMGERLDPASVEDLDFMRHGGIRDIFTVPQRKRERDAYLAKAREAVAERNRNHAVWGWKDPLSSYYLDGLARDLRNPYFIFVTRDLNAIAGREHVEEGRFSPQAVFGYLENALAQYADAIRIMRARRRPCYLVSYERALRAPAELARGLARFAGLEGGDALARWADSYVTADRGDASIAQEAIAAPRGAIRAGSDSLDFLLTESARVLTEPQLASWCETPEAALQEAQRLEQAARAALDRGDALGCQRDCFAILQLFARERPALKDGLLGVLADMVAGPAVLVLYPDAVIAAFSMIGRAYLLDGYAREALAYLQVAALLERARPGEMVADSAGRLALAQAAAALGRHDMDGS